MNLYDFTVKDQNGKDISLANFKGKTVLVVNTATGCGFTPQYEDLQDIYSELNKDGLEILDFPCNQFGNQASGEDEEIHDFCTGRYGITFPQYTKVEVNGENAIPLFKWLTANTKFKGFEGAMKLVLTPVVKKMDPDYKNNGNVKWNFTKFLIDKNGEIVDRFEPTASLEKVKNRIKEVM